MTPRARLAGHVLLAVKLIGEFEMDDHYDHEFDTPTPSLMDNLLVTILDRAGVPIEKSDDSTGPLKPDPLSVG